jgi:type I restriction enzyme R subunit
LETILKKQLKEVNKIEYKGKEFPFTESNINAAILALRDLPLQDGFMAASQTFFDMVTLGKSLNKMYWVIKRVSHLNTLIGKILKIMCTS